MRLNLVRNDQKETLTGGIKLECSQNRGYFPIVNNIVFYLKFPIMRIFIKNLNMNASENKLYKLFLKFGKVLKVEICAEPSGKSLGYGFVTMKEMTEGRNAINELNSINFMNQFLEIYEVNNSNLI